MSWPPLPESDWVLHSAPLLGGITDRWIDEQARTTDRFDSRLIGVDVAEGEEVRPHWLPAGTSRRARLAYARIDATRGALTGLIASEFEGRRPEVVHAHYGPNAAYHLPLAGRLGRPLVASFYGYDATKVEFQRERRWRRLYARLFDRASAVIAEGPAMAARVAGLGCPEGKLHVVRLPADERMLASCGRPKSDHFRVVAAGRFIEKKGFDTAIRAFARAFGRDGADARLSIVGGGEEEQRLHGLVADLGIEGQIDWGGRLSFVEFMSEISRAHLAVYPSRTAASGDSEGGAPVTLIESQWLGVPSLVSDHDDLPFVASPDGSLVLPATDADAWAGAMRDLAGDPARVEDMGRAAAAFSREHHSPASNVRARESVYGSAR